jgi:hypothetical protein
MTEHPPMYHAASFDCPHCEAHAQQTWYDAGRAENNTDAIDARLDVAVCFACGGRTVWRALSVYSFGRVIDDHQMIYPARNLEGPAPHADLPESLLPIYEEARGCLGVSPRAASALVRLTLEGALSDLYADAGNLNEMIGAAAAAGLPETVVNAMDVLRFSGNQSIHELRSDDTVETATALFAILNIVIERLVTQPRQIAELHAAMPDGVREGIERRNERARDTSVTQTAGDAGGATQPSDQPG